MKKQIIKMISLVFAIFLFLITPLGTHIQAKSARVYAVESTAMDAMGKYLFPIVALYTTQIKSTKGLVDSSKPLADLVAEEIDLLKQSKQVLWQALSLDVKARIAKYYTNLSNYDINAMLNTTFSDTQFGKYETEMINLQTKISNNEALTSSELQGLGVYKILANYLGYQSLNSLRIDTGDFGFSEIQGVRYLIFFQNGKTVMSAINRYDNSDFIKEVFLGFVYNAYNPVVHQSPDYVSFNDVLQIRLSNLYFFNLKRMDFSSNSKEVYLVHDILTRFEGEIKTFDDKVVKSFSISRNVDMTVKNFIDFIKNYSTYDFVNSDYYLNSQSYNLSDLLCLGRLGSLVYIPSNVWQGQYSFFDVIATTIDPSAVWEDVSSTAAERVIANEASTTSDTNIHVEEDDDRTTVIVTPNTGVAEDSNVDEGVDVDNPEGVFSPDGEGWIFRIPILGSILKALQNLYNLIRNWFTANPTTGNADPGMDWGNFKGFFDIFYIFYYLIILVIIILIKFFAVIVSLLDIPANATLFNAYPNLLVGLNYIKNIKVGGFNITLQQIFEYMFTVFFFLYIVTQLQKLYHSFSGIERHQLRANDKEARFEKYQSESHYTPTDFNAVKTAYDKNENDSYKNIKITDYTKGR